ncbi:hypothetical protein P280DRAFT_243955 [Massarina eburnea CBS 473.64]|uniref:FAD-binding FR-type domain-containing protein n=1 Tax=Massarina eburnea CBS 473.64 TaxID=1395130 RepID=A0A6A6S673_9PLEO|nr:hypothetical protein P280DRAFT_243955 [Massarina eburnea CBS 473.64]
MVQTRSAKARLSHEERTASEPRDASLCPVIIEKVVAINDRIRTYRFNIKDSERLNFLPGQFVDVHVPGIDKAGGFTITSSPRQAAPDTTDGDEPYIELAIMKSPDNPTAAWLWLPIEEIVGAEINVRVGGSFVWPPPGLDMSTITRAIFIAGGVGINPLISMLANHHDERPAIEVRLLYSTKVPSIDTQPSEVLFLPELLDLFRKPRSDTSKHRLELFLTGARDGTSLNRRDDEPIYPLMSLTLPKLHTDTEVPVVAWTHRIDDIALMSAAGSREEAKHTIFFICGPPDMTENTVEFLKKQPNVKPEYVLCEKWW